jgi:uncharacterized membrane-anchored protein YhcB (DUF1043 family)
VAVVALLFGIVIGCIVGWRLTSRSYKSLVSAIDSQNARLLTERREARAELDRVRALLSKADVALLNARSARDNQTQLIIDLTNQAAPSREAQQESASA